MSVAFRVPKGGDRWNEDRSRREVIEASLSRGDVTVTNFGCNEAATATISSRGAEGDKERRAYAEGLKGTTERRMCPVEGFDLREAPRGRSQLVVPSYVILARAKAARARAAQRSHPRRARRQLVLSPFGADWEISGASQLHRALLQVAVGHAKGPDEDAIRAWIAKRAEDLGVAEHVPAGWRNPALLAAYVEEHDPAVTAPSIGGQ
jgi:hypothetical protein